MKRIIRLKLIICGRCMPDRWLPWEQEQVVVADPIHPDLILLKVASLVDQAQDQDRITLLLILTPYRDICQVNIRRVLILLHLVHLFHRMEPVLRFINEELLRVRMVTEGSRIRIYRWVVRAHLMIRRGVGEKQSIREVGRVVWLVGQRG